MSGIKRALVAEMANKGLTGEAAMAQMTPEKIRKETGRSVHTKESTKADPGDYIGKNGYDATPTK